MNTMCSAFSGIGGFDLAAQRAGIQTTAQIEIEPFPRKVLQRRFPDATLLRDIRDVKAEDVGTIDLLAGGFPCQDLSVAGKRAGLAGERSGLFSELSRLAAELAPRWVFFENVPGLLSSDGWRDFGTILGALGELGYGYAYRVLDAQWFGVAQRRRRVLIVGCLGDARRAAEVLFEPASCPRDSAPSRQAGARVAASLSRGSARSSGVNEPGRRAEDDVNLVLDEQNAAGVAMVGALGTGMAHANRGFSVAATLNSGGNSGGFRTEPGEHLALTVSKQTRLDSEGHDAGEDDTGRGTPLIAFNWQSGQDQPQCSEDVAPMLHAGQTPAVGVRRLMPVECERLQGFPDGWTCLEGHPQQCDCPDSPRYRALGNAVAVPVIEWVLRRMQAVDSALTEAAA